MPNLYAIREYPELFADACCVNSDDDCLFLSLWGRDTAVQELLARLTLPLSQDGIDTLHIMEGETTYRVRFRNMDNYDKRTTRAFQKTRFGNLVQVWLFDLRCVSPDRANLESIVLIERDDPELINSKLWQRVTDLCPLPLLDHWQEEVMSWLHQQAIFLAETSLGPLCAWEIKLDQAVIATRLSGLIRTGVLTIEP